MLTTTCNKIGCCPTMSIAIRLIVLKRLANCSQRLQGTSGTSQRTILTAQGILLIPDTLTSLLVFNSTCLSRIEQSNSRAPTFKRQLRTVTPRGTLTADY